MIIIHPDIRACHLLRKSDFLYKHKSIITPKEIKHSISQSSEIWQNFKYFNGWDYLIQDQI